MRRMPSIILLHSNANERTRILDAADTQLREQPTTETRKRKRLRPNPLAPYELRVGDFRVYYDVDESPRRVPVLAIGRKRHNKVFIGDQEFKL